MHSSEQLSWARLEPGDEALLLEVLDDAIAVTQADFGNIQLLDPQNGDLRIVVQRGFPQWWLDYWNTVSEGHGACGTALERGHRIIVEDVEQSPVFVGTPELEIQRKAGVRAVQSTPLVSREGRKIGMLSTHFREPFRPNVRDEQLLDLLARHATDAIERSRAELARRKSEERFRAFFHNASFGAAQINRSGLFINVNDRFCDITGFSRMELIGRMGPLDLDHPDEVAADKARIAAFFAAPAPVYDYEKRYVRKDGRVIWVRIRVSAIRDLDGAIESTAAIIEDITESKDKSDKLARSEERLRLALSAGNMAVWDWDIDSGTVLWNDEHYKLLGYEPGSITPSYDSWRSRVFSDDLARVEAAIQNALRTSEDYTAVFRVLGKNDRIRWVEAHGRVELKPDRQPLRLYGVILDVTDRLTRENVLQQRLEEIEALYDNSPLGLALFDKELRYVRVNRPLAQINRVSAAAHVMKTLSEMLPDLAPTVGPQIRKVLSSGQIIHGETTTTMGGEGARRVFREIFYPLRERDGSVLKVGLIVEDITERKRAEEQATLLLKEVNHRAKNLLAVIQAIAQLTAADIEPEKFYQAFSSRLQGLAASHDLLVNSEWNGVSLASLIKSQLKHLEPLLDRRLFLKGPDVSLNPGAVQMIGMAVHELATNAIKYGALSTSEGCVTISWTVSSGALDAEPNFIMTWLEEGGPPVVNPLHKGLGHAVTVEMPQHLLEARVDLSFPPSGVVWKISAPLGQLGEPCH